jgi:facilitated trehalose transporter
MVLAPLYSTEIAQGSIRGALGSFSGGMLTVGALIDNTVGAFTHWNTLTIIIATIPCKYFNVHIYYVGNTPIYISGLHAICMFFMPESPVYSLSKGREAEARRSLQWLRGRKYDITEEIDQVNILLSIGYPFSMGCEMIFFLNIL